MDGRKRQLMKKFREKIFYIHCSLFTAARCFQHLLLPFFIYHQSFIILSPHLYQPTLLPSEYTPTLALLGPCLKRLNDSVGLLQKERSIVALGNLRTDLNARDSADAVFSLRPSINMSAIPSASHAPDNDEDSEDAEQERELVEEFRLLTRAFYEHGLPSNLVDPTHPQFRALEHSWDEPDRPTAADTYRSHRVFHVQEFNGARALPVGVKFFGRAPRRRAFVVAAVMVFQMVDNARVGSVSFRVLPSDGSSRAAARARIKRGDVDVSLEPIAKDFSRDFQWRDIEAYLGFAVLFERLGRRDDRFLPVLREFLQFHDGSRRHWRSYSTDELEIVGEAPAVIAID
jgi:hypothetical protein